MENKKTNEFIGKFREFIANYSSVNRQNFAKNEVVKIITKYIPELLNNRLNIDNKFYIKGSCGNGNPAEIPWISIFIRKITTKATKGIYIVFLIKADLSGMYLSLNQGFTYFIDKYGKKQGIEKIKIASEEIRNILSGIPDNSIIFNIDLKCSNHLGKGYEAGNIFAKYYDVNNMPNDLDLIKDIKEFMIVYNELKNIIGNRSIEQFYEYILLKNDGYEISEKDELKRINEILVISETQEEYAIGFNAIKKEKKKLL